MGRSRARLRLGMSEPYKRLFHDGWVILPDLLSSSAMVQYRGEVIKIYENGSRVRRAPPHNEMKNHPTVLATIDAVLDGRRYEFAELIGGKEERVNDTPWHWDSLIRVPEMRAPLDTGARCD